MFHKLQYDAARTRAADVLSLFKTIMLECCTFDSEPDSQLFGNSTMHDINRKVFLQQMTALLGAGVYAQNSLAQSTWPNKPIHFIVPFAPGGANDLIARAGARRPLWQSSHWPHLVQMEQ